MLEFGLFRLKVSVKTVSSVIRLSPPLSCHQNRWLGGGGSKSVYIGVQMLYLCGGCCVDVVEESLEIIAGKGAVHLLAGP